MSKVARTAHAPGPHVAMGETDSVFCEGVDIWRIHPVGGFRIATYCAVRLVVGEDEEDVWLLISLVSVGSEGNQKADSCPKLVFGCYFHLVVELGFIELMTDLINAKRIVQLRLPGITDT